MVRFELLNLNVENVLLMIFSLNIYLDTEVVIEYWC